MNFFRKHRFKVLISSLSIVLIVVSFYMLWVHVPFAKNENCLETIKNNIIEKSKYQYKDYFHEYVGEDTFYILKIEENKEEKFVAFDTNQKFVKSFAGEIVDQTQVEQMFKEKYQVDVKTVEIGYEDGLFMYCLTYLKEGVLIYAYYGLDSGEFIKAYQFG